VIPVFVLALAGLASWPLWPTAWLPGLVSGWVAALAVEAVLVARRRALLASADNRRTALSALLAFGFLAKALLLLGGGVLGAYAHLFSPESFVLAFLAGVLLGEAVGLPAVLLRASRARESKGTGPKSSRTDS